MLNEGRDPIEVPQRPLARRAVGSDSEQTLLLLPHHSFLIPTS
jgi:hypothetical protein